MQQLVISFMFMKSSNREHHGRPQKKMQGWAKREILRKSWVAKPKGVWGTEALACGGQNPPQAKGVLYLVVANC